MNKHSVYSGTRCRHAQRLCNITVVFTAMDFGPLSQAFSMNPFLMGGGSGIPNGSMMSQLMGAAGLHQGWAGALSGKTVNQLWMKDENKVTI